MLFFLPFSFLTHELILCFFLKEVCFFNQVLLVDLLKFIYRLQHKPSRIYGLKAKIKRDSMGGNNKCLVYTSTS